MELDHPQQLVEQSSNFPKQRYVRIQMLSEGIKWGVFLGVVTPKTTSHDYISDKSSHNNTTRISKRQVIDIIH
jgi:hypothetical protein